jgi:hypothetical protein
LHSLSAKAFSKKGKVKINGAVAQLVEQWTENPCVAGSIPAHTTKALEQSSLRLLFSATVR